MLNAMKKIAAAALCAASVATAAPALAGGGGVHLPQLDWSFSGPFGTFDKAARQRGFQVYKEVCSACHAMDHTYYRNLTEIGFSEDDVKKIAAEYSVVDGPNDSGDMFERPARPSDKFKKPFPNANAARAANGGAAPPDLSLIIKSRADGANYVHALLTGYADPPAGEEIKEGLNYNKYFPGNWVAMVKPISDDQITYADGTPATVDQMSRDVVQFLAWAAEPELEKRKRIGLQVMLFLLVLSGMMYVVKRKIWSDLH